MHLSFYPLVFILALSPHGHWHWVNANGHTQLGCREDGDILLSANSSMVTQHGCEEALGRGVSQVRQLCSALPHLLLASLPCASRLREMSPVFEHRQETQSSVFGGRGSPLSEPKGAVLDRSSLPWRLIGPSSCKWGLQSLTIWLVQRVLSGLIRMELLWWVGEEADKDKAAQLWLDGESLGPIGWNRIPGAAL